MTSVPANHPDTTFTAATLRVLANMGRKLTSTRQPMFAGPGSIPGEGLDEYRARQRQFEHNLLQMASSLGSALEYVATPGVRLWPDNGREDCLSLSGSLHGIQFGLIFHPNADGTGTWSFHS